MPRKFRRARLRQGGLTDEQRDCLLYGFSSESANPEGSEMRAAWSRCHAELMADPELGSGRRPRGFYLFDLKVEVPRRWWNELELLDDLKLLDRAEEFTIELRTPILATTQVPEFNVVFLQATAIQSMQLSRSVLSDLQEQFCFVAQWHRKRDRPELATKYTRCAATISAVLGEPEEKHYG